jgi:hypothetical protein
MKKWMKIALGVILTLTLAIKLISLFGEGNGKKFEVDKTHHVYYKGDGVTENDAKKTGDYLKEIGLFAPGNTMDVQIMAEKPTDEVKLSYVVDKAKITPESESTFLMISNSISSTVFNGRKVMIALVDENMDEVKNLGYATSQAKNLLTE